MIKNFNDDNLREVMVDLRKDIRMNEQKFKRGNLVKVLVGHPIWNNGVIEDMSPQDRGRLAIIDYSYAERYGGSDVDSYSIIWMDTGSSLAWKRTSELQFVDIGGEHLFAEAKKVREEYRRKNTDISYILENIETGLGSESILFLFGMIGFKSAFLLNGEYFVLFEDWSVLQPAFVHIKDSQTIEEAKSIFSEDGLKSLNINKVWESFHNKDKNEQKHTVESRRS